LESSDNWQYRLWLLKESVNVRKSILTVLAVALFSPLPSAAADKYQQQVLEAQKAELEGRYQNAVDIYGGAIRKNPNGIELQKLLKSRGLAYEQLNQLDNAEADLNAALKVEPADPILYADRGYFYLRRGRFDQALADFTLGAQKDLTNPLYKLATGRVHAARKDFGGAIDLYNDALNMNPTYVVALLSRAEAYVQLNMISEAKADYDKALGLKLSRRGDLFFVFLGRGYVNIILKHFEDAARDLEEAVNLEPKNVNALLYRGYAHEMDGKLDLAQADYKRALVLDPNNAWAQASRERLDQPKARRTQAPAPGGQ
jgi:tetratricopeptide (TPR) repeat protein